MKKFRRTLIWFSLVLLLPGVGILSSCGDSGGNSDAQTGSKVRAENSAQQSMRGIKPVSKSTAKAHQQRLAMVIGNGNYEKSKLKNPVNDARCMARLLRRLDFEVDLIENGSRKKMVREMNAFGRKLQQSNVGLFYYAGHGVQVQGHNYLIPIDAVLESEADVEFEAIDLGRILGKMEDSHCPLNIVVLDACRDNPFARSFRSVSKGLALVDAPRGTLLAFSTAPGSVAADGNGNNGIYTKYLLANIERPDLSIEQVFKQVRIGVVNETDGKQTPWESSSLMGDFHFQPNWAKTTSPLPQTASLAPKIDIEKPRNQPVAAKKRVSPAAAQTPSTKKPKTYQVANTGSRHRPAPAVRLPKISPEVKKYIRMINSSSSKEQRNAAKIICRSYLHNHKLLETVKGKLLQGYQKNSRDRHHVDAMAWFCNVLGRSKQTCYIETLEIVANSDANRKLKKYAKKNLRYLQR